RLTFVIEVHYAFPNTSRDVAPCATASGEGALRMRLSIAMAASLLLATAAYAQTTGAATIVGNVTDTTGAVIPGAKVIVVNPLTGFTFDAVTNQEGAYYVPYLRPGVYNVNIEAQ